MSDINILNEYGKSIGLHFDDTQLSQFQRYYELLIEWNDKINLTTITEYNDVMLKHFIDSVSITFGKDTNLISRLVNGESISVIDVGCGAGFPSLPLKIAFPNLKVTMLDSLNKRINFLNVVIDELGLKDITAVHGRAEDFAKPDKLRESFDICVSRAVANLSTLSEYCLPYVKVGGALVAYKAELAPDELDPGKKAIYILGGDIEKIYQFVLPDSDYHRSLCVVSKKKVTPKKFPRKAGLPSKEPIGKEMNC